MEVDRQRQKSLTRQSISTEGVAYNHRSICWTTRILYYFSVPFTGQRCNTVNHINNNDNDHDENNFNKSLRLEPKNDIFQLLWYI